MPPSFVAVVISVVSYFKIPALCTHVMLNWLINVYWIWPLAWQKYWIIEALPRKISIPSTFPFFPSLQCSFENPASANAFPLFQTLFFISSFVKFQLTPLQFGFRGLWANLIMDSKFVVINHRLLFLALKKIWIFKITPPQVLTNTLLNKLLG